MKKFTILILLFVFSFAGVAQQVAPFEVVVAPVSLNQMPGIHSFAFAQHNGKWLLIGGRLDGLHARQPFNAFNAANSNTNLYVFDPTTDSVWSASVSALPTQFSEQLQSTNMNFHQEGDTLYIIGGYGFSASANTHVTYDKLTTVAVSSLMQAIMANQQPITGYFKQISDPIFKNTGGQLNNIGGYFHLIGGHEFNGRYNAMGGPSYTQVYKTNIHRFTIDNSGSQLSFGNYSTQNDPVHLRRRDYNLIEQIDPNGSHYLTISAGVFQEQANLPFLYPVEITATNYTPRTDFNQYLSHYHGAKVSLYDANAAENHTLFFGGMAQFYFDGNDLLEDQGVPFVKTISRLTRYSDSSYQEFNLPIEMPALQGASSEFIANTTLPMVQGKVIDFAALPHNDTVVLGHIVGGIFSPIPHAFNGNQTTQTYADPSIFEVKIIKNTSVSHAAVEGANPFKSSVYPNPVVDAIQLLVTLPSQGKIAYSITNLEGKTLANGTLEGLSKGERTLHIPVAAGLASGTYFVNLIFNDRFYNTHKVIKR
ncbi:MAG: T9SS type A sorting domain-containing protein [Schleiferiaceae bacterium]|nr:T9SS type A sorting domain-containing protein [Schleiferiaceae bacterium]